MQGRSRRGYSHPGWQEVAVKEAEWTFLMGIIIKDNLNEIESILIQQMLHARTGEKKMPPGFWKRE